MIPHFISWIGMLGLPGLFLIMALDGISLPFPSFILVFSFGYALFPDYFQAISIAIGMSFFYTAASLIPYFIGLKFNQMITGKFKRAFNRASAFFRRYGSWSVAVSRPFAIGSCISYFAGMSRMKIAPYLGLTFLGIYPWAYGAIMLGALFKGNYLKFNHLYIHYFLPVYVLFFFMVLGIIGYHLHRRRRGSNRGKKKG